MSVAVEEVPSAPGPVPRRALGFALRLALAGALLGWLFRSGVFEVERLVRLSGEWRSFGLSLGLLLAATVVTALRLPVLLRPLGFVLRPVSAIRLTLLGMFFSVFLPGGAGGDIAKIYYAVGGHDGRRAELATAVLLDRGLALVAMLAWPALVLPFAWPLFESSAAVRTLLAVAGAAAFAGFAFLAAAVLSPERAAQRAEGLIARLPLGPVGPLVSRVWATLRFLRAAPGAVVVNFALSLVAHALAFAGVLALAGAVIGAPASAYMALLVPLGFTANTLPLTPGGIGVGEVAFDRLFAIASLDGGGELMLAWRVLLIGVSLLGAIAYIDARKHFVERARPAAEPGVEG